MVNIDDSSLASLIQSGNKIKLHTVSPCGAGFSPFGVVASPQAPSATSQTSKGPFPNCTEPTAPTPSRYASSKLPKLLPAELATPEQAPKSDIASSK